MTQAGQKLLQDALLLPDVDREEMAALLLGSIPLSSDPEIDAAWEAEIDRRISEIESGTAKTIPWEEVLGELECGRPDCEAE